MSRKKESPGTATGGTPQDRHRAGHSTCANCGTTRRRDAAIPPLPQIGAARLAWFRQLDEIVAADVAAMAENLAAQGWSAGDVEAISVDFGRWLASRIRGACDLVVIDFSWSVSTSGSGSRSW